ncbi:uncharacterized protein [Oscarella lobularis]|uniref:uncharacterized protein n=1 Tax=Oscarella lobularis TaxID=121494 RepID=UPI0033130BAC
MDQNPPDQALQNPPDQAQRLQDQQPAIQQQRDAQNPVVAVTGPALQAIIQNAVQAGVAAYAQHAGQAALPADGASDGNASREHALEELPQMPAIPGIAVLGDGEAPPGVVPSAAAVDGTSFGALARALAQAVPPPTSPDFALEDGVSVSGKMVAKIQAGQYVELAELLPDNLELLKREVGPFFEWMPQSRSQLRSIPSVLSWARCFSTYAIVRCAGDPSRAASLFSYMRLILQEAAKLGGEGWRTYDTRFRKLAAVRPAMDWATPHQGIYAQTFVALGNNAPRCPLCLDTDHVKAVCSLRDASTDRNVARAASPAGARTKPRPICRGYNEGACQFPNCTYRHVCNVCWGAHRAKHCDSPRRERNDPGKGERGRESRGVRRGSDRERSPVSRGGRPE